jgi:hypothetical protein
VKIKVVEVDNDGTLRKDVEAKFLEYGLGNSKITEPFRELVFLITEMLPNKWIANLSGQIKESFKEELDMKLVEQLSMVQRKRSDIKLVVSTANPNVSKSDMSFMKDVLASYGLKVSVGEKGAFVDVAVRDGLLSSVAKLKRSREVIIEERSYNERLGKALSKLSSRIHYAETSDIAKVISRVT